MVQPKNITKLNEHVDAFMCRDGWDPGATPSLRRCAGDANSDLSGSFRISKVLAFPLQSIEQCSAHSRYLTFVERKKIR